MTITPRARASRGLRTTALCCAGLVSGAALLLAGCSQGGPAGSESSAARPGGQHAPAALGSAASGSGAPGAPVAAPPEPASGPLPARLALATQSIIYTASLTLRATSVTAAASRATGLVISQGGYVSSEHSSASPAGHAQATVSLQLKIPVGVYQPTLARLARLGAQVSLSEQATDATQQVADTSSLVTSAQDAITQLEALLKRAGSIGDLLSVQDQINEQESSLEALQAQQRALAAETSYATVSVTLVGPPPPRRHVPVKKQRHGFTAGLASGWRGLRLVVSAILTAAGAVLPFAVVALLLAGVGYAGRRRLRRLLRALRRGSRPTTAG
jgi:hypothetical protein